MKPILFNTEMVRAILDGNKTVTRRVIKYKSTDPKSTLESFCNGNMDLLIGCCPYRKADILYTRETWINDGVRYLYRANYIDGEAFYRGGEQIDIKWRPSIHMPREAARLFLRVTDVRVEQLQDITLDDFLNEGITLRPEAFNDPENAYGQAKKYFKNLWNSTIQKRDGTGSMTMEGNKVSKKTSVYTYAQMQKMQALPLENKINVAKQIIRETFARGQRVALAFSGGKDSTVLWHLIRETCPEESKSMIAIFGNTGVEYKESLDFARALGKEWGGANFYETKLSRIKVPRLKYEAQKEVWALIEERGEVAHYLNKKGRLLATDKLNEAVTPEMWENFRRRKLVWEVGTQVSFWFIAEQYGFPILGKDATKLDAPRININVFLKYSEEQSKGNEKYYDMLKKFPDMRISHSCCNFIKEQPSEKLQRKLGCDTLFRGLLANESRRRTFTFLDNGFLYQSRRNLYSQPLAIFRDTDIWAYIKSRNCPYSALYDLTDADGNKLFTRNGCYVCGTGLAYQGNNIEILRKQYPQKWKSLMRYGMAREMKTFACAISDDIKLNLLESEWLIDKRPCAFDRLTPRSDLIEAMQYADTLF